MFKTITIGFLIDWMMKWLTAWCAKGYRASNAYILTQMPLPHTVIDLWRMIYEHKCGTIVMLNPFDETDTVTLSVGNLMLYIARMYSQNIFDDVLTCLVCWKASLFCVFVRVGKNKVFFQKSLVWWVLVGVS